MVERMCSRYSWRALSSEPSASERLPGGVPGDPLRTYLKLLGYVLRPDREDAVACVYCHVHSFLRGGGPVWWGHRKLPNYQGISSKSFSGSSGSTVFCGFGSSLDRTAWTFSTLS